MAATMHTTHAPEPAAKSSPPSTSIEHEPAAAAGSDALLTVSRMMYSGSYALAYGVVYAAVFLAQSLPQENPVMQGLRDGGKAAMDELSRS